MLERIRKHFWDLKNNRHDNQHLQCSYNKHGEDAFLYSVLEYCTVENQFERE